MINANDSLAVNAGQLRHFSNQVHACDRVYAAVETPNGVILLPVTGFTVDMQAAKDEQPAQRTLILKLGA